MKRLFILISMAALMISVVLCLMLSDRDKKNYIGLPIKSIERLAATGDFSGKDLYNNGIVRRSIQLNLKRLHDEDVVVESTISKNRTVLRETNLISSEIYRDGVIEKKYIYFWPFGRFKI